MIFLDKIRFECLVIINKVVTVLKSVVNKKLSLKATIFVVSYDIHSYCTKCIRGRANLC